MKESDAKRLLKLREVDIERGLPVNSKLNRIRFEEAAEDLKTEYAVNGRRSADELERRIRLHLLPHFGGRRLAVTQTTDINTFILKRRSDVIVFGESEQRRERKVSNGEINRELTTLKRIFNLARQNGKLTHVPHIPMLKERNVRTGFFEREQIIRIVAYLPPAIRPAVQFAYITGWRIPSEVLPLQWRHVDFEARVVRLDPHTTKNDEGRTFPFTDALEQLLGTYVVLLVPWSTPVRRTPVSEGEHVLLRRSAPSCVAGPVAFTLSAFEWASRSPILVYQEANTHPG
jgi:integrase